MLEFRNLARYLYLNLIQRTKTHFFYALSTAIYLPGDGKTSHPFRFDFLAEPVFVNKVSSFFFGAQSEQIDLTCVVGIVSCNIF